MNCTLYFKCIKYDLLLNVLFLPNEAIWTISCVRIQYFLLREICNFVVMNAEHVIFFFFFFQRYVWLLDLLQLHEVSFAVLLLLLLFIIIVVDIIGLQVPTRNLREFPLSHVSPFSKHFRTARCATSENYICSDLDVFRRQIITLSKFGIFICLLLWDAIIIYVRVIVFLLFVLNVYPWLMRIVVCVCMLCSVCN